MSNQTTENLGVLSKNSAKAAALPWWLLTIVTLGASLMVAGATIALLRPLLLATRHDEINEAVRLYAGYFAARNLGIGMLLLAALSVRARAMLKSLLVLTAVIQLFDAIIDCVEGRWAVLPGVIILGLAFFCAAKWMYKYSAPEKPSAVISANSR